MMFDSLGAESLKLRRLWLPAIAIASGLALTGLLWLSMSSVAHRLATEERMEVPWQDGLIGDVTISMTLILPSLVILVTALCFFVEHRGNMWKQLRATPKPIWTIYAAKFVAIQALIGLAILTAAITALAGWTLLADPLQSELAASMGQALQSVLALAGMLYLALLPVSVIQFLLSARLTNILYPVGFGLVATFACLMAMGPGTGRWLPYAYPGAVIMNRFADPAAKADQETDTDYRAPVEALAGVSPDATILIDDAHNNRHGIGTPHEPGSLHWLTRPAEAARLPLRSAGPQLDAAALAGTRLLIVAGASYALSPTEVDSVLEWVGSGGSLLLLTDHEPFASPAAELARRLGTRFSIAMVSAPGGDGARLRYTREEGGIAAHVITSGVRSVQTYGGQALWRPEPDTINLLKLRGAELEPGASQLIAFSVGRGRVVISGETGLFTAQRHGDGSLVGVADRTVDNERLVINVMRWLLRL